MKNFISLINGQFKDQLSVLDRGVSYGDGFFETMKWSYSRNRKHSGVEFWKRHVKRIKKTSKILGIKLPKTKILDEYKSIILDKAKQNGYSNGILKIIITRGVGGRGYRYEEDMLPTIIFLVFPSVSNFKNDINLKFCSTSLSENKVLAGLKHLNRIDSVIARSEWKTDKIYEGVFLDSDNFLIEGTMSNIFLIKNGTLYTPPLSHSGIEGIMREVLIEKGKLFFKSVKITRISKERLNEFDEMFISNSIIKVLPVKQIENIKFSIFSSTQKIIDYFSKNKNLEFS